jgi:hypothetical protein
MSMVTGVSKVNESFVLLLLFNLHNIAFRDKPSHPYSIPHTQKQKIFNPVLLLRRAF